MRLKQLGWNSHFENLFSVFQTSSCAPARVAEENRGLYRVFTEEREHLAQVRGRVRFEADNKNDLPSVGDWVAVETSASGYRATIVAVLLPRQAILSRKTPGRSVDEQILAVNVDTVFIVTSLNQDFNLRRIERYLAVVWNSGAKPVVLLNKADLCANPGVFCREVERASCGAPVHALSAATGDGLEIIKRHLGPGDTAAFIGSSGVGKSTIINALAGRDWQPVQEVRVRDDRGRHTTTSRQMILLPEGGVVVDTPGMRELQVWEGDGLVRAFEDLELLARDCRFRDCCHEVEPGCAVTQALLEGVLSFERIGNFRKLQAEQQFLQSKVDFNLRHKQKQRAKRGCKALKRNHVKF